MFSKKVIDVYERVPEGLRDAFKPSLQELKTVRNTLLNRYFAIVKKISVSNQLVAVSVNAIKQVCAYAHQTFTNRCYCIPT